jgi:23S rRNA (uracil1939-C5)-methyltransferase
MLKIKIEKIAYGGLGVGYNQGKVVFVPQTAPGDIVRVRIIKSKKGYDLAELVDLLNPSSCRTTPPCPYYGRCGGCQLQHIAYPTQLMLKTYQVVESLERIGNYLDPPVYEMLGSPQAFGYRNKGVYHCTISPGSSLNIGFIGWEKDKIINIEHCLLQTPQSNQILREIKAIVQEFIEIWDYNSSLTPLFRYLVIRHSISSQNLLVILVLSREGFRGRDNLIEQLKGLKEKVSSMIFNINSRSNHSLLGPTYFPIWGEGYLTEQLDSIQFLISPSAFFQVNTHQTQHLLRLIRDYLNLKGNEFILDLYSGVGTIALSLASASKEIYGVEIDRTATLDAIKNATHNRVNNCSFRTGKVEKILHKIWVKGIKPDIVILDPPRSGCHPQVILGIRRLKVPRLIYISCNPATLARDLKRFKEIGYTLQLVQPLDMFPQTYHIECVSYLTQ